jgi:hypothetical protein
MMPGAQTADDARVGDHTAGVLAVMARTLIAIGQTGADDGLVRDGTAIQDMMCARHGRQRRRLGWTRVEVEREYDLIHDAVDGFVRREGAHRTRADLDAPLTIVHQLLDRAEAASLDAFDESGGTGDGHPPGSGAR